MAELERDLTRMRAALQAIERRSSSALLRKLTRTETQDEMFAIHKLANEALTSTAKAAAR